MEQVVSLLGQDLQLPLYIRTVHNNKGTSVIYRPEEIDLLDDGRKVVCYYAEKLS